MTDDLGELEAIALAATPGPWCAVLLEEIGSFLPAYDICSTNKKGCPVSLLDVEIWCNGANQTASLEKNNAEFLEACSPDRVLKLIGRIRELEQELSKAPLP